MGKNFIHGFAGNFAKEHNGPNFVAMGPAYAQWNFLEGSTAGGVWTHGAGYAVLTCNTGSGYMTGLFDFQMLATAGATTIGVTLSSGGTDDPFYPTASCVPSVNGTVISLGGVELGDNNPLTGNMTVPYYRYRIGASIIASNAALTSGGWVRLDFALS